MGKRSGVPHRDDELARLSPAEIEAEIARARVRLRHAETGRTHKAFEKHIHWLEAELRRRD